ncbi:MAG: hypothetical protein ACRC5Q_06680, partial [Culicoidibacterales bacterium]
IYAYILPGQSLMTETLMSEAIVTFYQAAGFAILDIEDVFLHIAFYDYEPICDVEMARNRLYREVIGYGMIADSKIKTTIPQKQEDEILAYYQQQGVESESFEQLLQYFPCTQAWTRVKAPTAVAIEPNHKLF